MWERIARQALLTLSVLLATFLGYLLFRNADSAQNSRPLTPESIEQADAKILEFTFTQSKGNVVQWQVQAKQARLFEQDKRAVLRDVALTFYGTGGDEVTVHGEEGTLDTATKNFRLANRQTPIVVETRSGYTIYTNHLVWTDETKRNSDRGSCPHGGAWIRGEGARAAWAEWNPKNLRCYRMCMWIWLLLLSAFCVGSTSAAPSAESVNSEEERGGVQCPNHNYLKENDGQKSRQPGDF